MEKRGKSSHTVIQTVHDHNRHAFILAFLHSCIAAFLHSCIHTTEINPCSLRVKKNHDFTARLRTPFYLSLSIAKNSLPDIKSIGVP